MIASAPLPHSPVLTPSRLHLIFAAMRGVSRLLISVLLVVGTMVSAVVPHGSAHSAVPDAAAAHHLEGHGTPSTENCAEDACPADNEHAECVAVASHCVTILPAVGVAVPVRLPLSLRQNPGEVMTFRARMPETETPPPRV